MEENRFKGLSDKDWQKQALKIETDPECYNTIDFERKMWIGSLIVYSIIILIIKYAV